MITLTTTLTLTKNARHLTKDTQAIHRTIAYATGETNLWGLPDPHHLIIRHKTPINWDQAMPGIIKQAITTPTPTPITGTHIRWGIIANPTKSTPQPHGKRGKITPLPPEKWNTWIDKKLHQNTRKHPILMTTITPKAAHMITLDITTTSPFHHGAGTAGNTSILRTQDVVQKDGTITKIPFLSAASIRHTIREHLAWHTAHTLQWENGTLTKQLVDLIWTGGLEIVFHLERIEDVTNRPPEASFFFPLKENTPLTRDEGGD